MGEKREARLDEALDKYAALAAQIGANVMTGIYVKHWDAVVVRRTLSDDGSEVVFTFDEVTRTEPEGEYTVEVGRQTFTAAQWEAVQTYVTGRLADPGPTEEEEE